MHTVYRLFVDGNYLGQYYSKTYVENLAKLKRKLGCKRVVVQPVKKMD